MYAAFGVASPFLPAFLSERGLPPEQLGLVLGAGTAMRLITSPVAGRIGDLLQALRIVLVVCLAVAAAQAIYGTAGIGAATAMLTFAAGALYAHFGAAGVLVHGGVVRDCTSPDMEVETAGFGRSAR